MLYSFTILSVNIYNYSLISILQKWKLLQGSLDITFGKFQHDVDNIINDTKHTIVDKEEIEDDIKHCSKRCCLKCFFNRICCFLEYKLFSFH